jgi:putative nucleotidyltransferase with HDIG domain
LRQSNELDLLFQVLPELSPLQGQTQPAPHQFDVLEHSLRVADRLAAWVWATDANAHVWRELEPYSARIQAHLHQVLTLDRSRAALLVLAGLLHDMGKPAVAQTSEAGVVRFHGHESVGAEMAMRRAEGLHLSRSEVDSLGRIVANHMRPGQLAKETSLSGRAVYRFYRATGEEGVDICLLAMADLVGQSGAGPDDTRWEARLRVVRRLLEAYFDRRDQEVVPTPLVSGKELMLELNLKQGPQVGRLLEAIRQEQAEGTIGSREQALAFAARHTLDADVADGE